MNKITLDTFIQKYNLGGNVNSVKWDSDGSTLSTRFISPDKSLLGELTLSKQSLPTFEVGVYDTPLLSRMLGTLADNVDFTLIQVEIRLSLFILRIQSYQSIMFWLLLVLFLMYLN